jgi:hypothetical protein
VADTVPVRIGGPVKSDTIPSPSTHPTSNRIGSVAEFRHAGLALARRDGHAVMFSMNILDGGVQDLTGAWDCPGTGIGTLAPNCRVAPSEVRVA